MKFDTPAATNPIDQLKVIGKPTDRIDGPLKTTGTAPYAYDRYDVVANQAYGYVIGAAIAKGRISSISLGDAKAAPGVLAIVTAENAGKLGKGKRNTANLLGGPEIDHYRRGGDIRAGACGFATGQCQLYPSGRPIRPGGREELRDQTRQDNRWPA